MRGLSGEHSPTLIRSDGRTDRGCWRPRLQPRTPVLAGRAWRAGSEAGEPRPTGHTCCRGRELGWGHSGRGRLCAPPPVEPRVAAGGARGAAQRRFPGAQRQPGEAFKSPGWAEASGPSSTRRCPGVCREGPFSPPPDATVWPERPATPRVPGPSRLPSHAGVACPPTQRPNNIHDSPISQTGEQGAGVRRKAEGEGPGSNPLVFFFNFKIIYFMSQSLFVKTTNIQFGLA